MFCFAYYFGQANLRVITLLAVMMLSAALLTVVAATTPPLPTPEDSDNDEFFDTVQDGTDLPEIQNQENAAPGSGAETNVTFAKSKPSVHAEQTNPKQVIGGRIGKVNLKDKLDNAKAAYVKAKMSYKTESNLQPEKLQESLANIAKTKVAWKEAALAFAVQGGREEEIENAKNELDDAQLKLLNHDKPWYSRWIRNYPKSNMFGAFSGGLLLGGAVMWYAKDPIRNLWGKTESPTAFADSKMTFPQFPSTVKPQPEEGVNVWWLVVTIMVVVVSLLALGYFVFGTDEEDFYYYQDYEQDNTRRPRPRRRDGHAHRRSEERGHKKRHH